MSLPDEEFDVLGEDELALLTRTFERMHENRVNSRRNSRTCFRCVKQGHFITDCPEEMEAKDNYKHLPRMESKAPLEAQRQAQAQEQGRAEIEEEGRPRQEGPSDGRCERCRLQLRLLYLELQ
jgi:hypothetical protein